MTVLITYSGNITTNSATKPNFIKDLKPFWRHKGTKNTHHLLPKQYHFNICLYIKNII